MLAGVHGLVPQVLDSVLEPTQSLPPLSTPLHGRQRDCVPLLHVLEQAPHFDHAPHVPSTGQASVLQVPVDVLDPEQGFPFHFGAGLVQVRVRVREPVPHDLEQGP